MVRQQRFDCFARSVDELVRDLQNEHASGLVAEQQLLLPYPLIQRVTVVPTIQRFVALWPISGGHDLIYGDQGADT